MDDITVEPESRPSDSWLSLEEAVTRTLGEAVEAYTEYEGERRLHTKKLEELSVELIRYITTKHDTALNPNRSKGESIVADCLLHGEPFFVFRARDIFTPMVLKQYVRMLEDYGPDDPDFQGNIVDWLNALKKWQTENVAKVRYPD